MTQIEQNRAEVAYRLECRREERRLAEINRKLAEDEAAYKAEISRQMDCGYLFNAINRDNNKWDGKAPVKLYDADSGAMAAQREKEWWDDFPGLHGFIVGIGLFMGLCIIAQIVVGSLGI